MPQRPLKEFGFCVPGDGEPLRFQYRGAGLHFWLQLEDRFTQQRRLPELKPDADLIKGCSRKNEESVPRQTQRDLRTDQTWEGRERNQGQGASHCDQVPEQQPLGPVCGWGIWQNTSSPPCDMLPPRCLCNIHMEPGGVQQRSGSEIGTWGASARRRFWY